MIRRLAEFSREGMASAGWGHGWAGAYLGRVGVPGMACAAQGCLLKASSRAVTCTVVNARQHTLVAELKMGFSGCQGRGGEESGCL